MIIPAILLKELCDAKCISGDESSVNNVIKEYMETFLPAAEITEDTLGNLIVCAGKKDAERRVMLDAHTDQIGLVVTAITDGGFLKVAPVGGVDRRVLPASFVTVHGSKDISGVVGFMPPHLTSDDGSEFPDITDMYIDTGLVKEKAEELIPLGTAVTINGDFSLMLNDRVTASALDDRSGCLALLMCAEMLSKTDLDCAVIFSFSSREELHCEGAKTAGYSICPTEAIAVDVTFADQPGLPEEKTCKLGGGPMLGIAPTLDKSLSQRLIEICKQKEIPYDVEIMSGTTGTDADSITVSRGGVPAVTVSIPLRNMHTPVEIVDMNDIENTAKLLYEYIVGGV